jgi:hypothetical protein
MSGIGKVSANFLCGSEFGNISFSWMKVQIT